MKKLLVLFVILLMTAAVSALEVTINDYDPKPSEAGKFVNIWFKVENIGSTSVQESFLEIIPKDGLTLAAGQESETRIGILDTRGYSIVQYRLFVNNDAIEGANLIEAKVTQGQTVTSKDLFLEVTEKDILDVDLQIGNIQSEPTRIKPGDDDIQLTVTVQNLGDGTAQNVRSELKDLPQGVSFSQSYSNIDLLGNIEEDDVAQGVFYIDVEQDAPSGEHFATLVLNYKYKPDADEDDFVVEEIELPVQLTIKPIPLYKIVRAEVDKEQLRAGDTGVKLKLTIKNVGEEEGESVRLKIYGKSEHPFDFDVSSNFLAPKLLPGETAQTTLEFDIEEGANLQKYLMDLEIKNVVNDDIITYDHTIPIEVALPKEDNPTKWIVIGVVIIVLIALVFIFMRKGKKSKKARKVKHSYDKGYLDK